ncbi:MAG: hypothetical protein A2946_01570 [Candidatus Liptonbacteria bacterium RIFCSPLOWO2_01_FULL_53_13]|uniref:DUF86 domain-containing protein n=1 Tax=Candidatus Liptonbacteria bacterium RIFCSPLOWO2_01_FULL_53_13 TaxID=1798651 RepID=A0A1G2CMG9_9BACT|nr:MAG: hypothetical protein A2946_01570 [Candidatus Liptonbacteria bacterium RIFCSPLOWO2_01_FULL_53_13]
MKDAARKTSLFLKGYKMRKFLMDGKTQSAVIMQLIVIGELAKKVPDRAKKKINLPWRLIAGFRDLAVHQYFELDLPKVWDTATKDVPVLEKKLAQYLKRK